MVQVNWLTTWLKRVRPDRSTYSNFQHLEFAEDVATRPHVQKHLAELLRVYHTHSQFNRDLLARIGYSALARVLTGDQRPQTEATRTGNLMEILSCEIAKQTANYDIPVLRLRFNPNREQSMKGDDLLGFRFSDETTEPDVVLIGESKFRSTFNTAAIKEAYEALAKGFRPYPASLEFVATILSVQGDRQKADRIRQIGRRLASQSRAWQVHRSYVLFLGTVGEPQNPFESLEELGDDILPSLTAVNFVFGEAFVEWINDTYKQME